MRIQEPLWVPLVVLALILGGCIPETKPTGSPAPASASAVAEKSRSATLNAVPAPENKSTASGPPNGGARTEGRAKRDPDARVVPEGLLRASKELRQMKVPDAPSDGWKPSDLTPKQIASNADDALGSLIGVYAEASMHVKSGAGAGQTQSRMEFQDAGHYALQYIELVDGRPQNSFARADGHGRGLLAGATSKWVAQVPIGSVGAIPSGASLVEQWPTRFPRLLLSPVLDGKRPFSAYVEALSQGIGGYKLSADKRLLAAQGRLFTSYRIVVVRDANRSVKHAPTRVEMVFDADFRLPVTIRTHSESSNGGQVDLFWSCAWAFKKTFNPADFVLPKDLG